jgi:hypothetical protein
MTFAFKLILLIFIFGLTNAIADGPTNIALNPTESGYPHPLESDSGWGCCPNKWAMIDGQIAAPAWYYGFAWRGGTRHWAGGSCGWKQATITFNEPKTFNKVITYHHGTLHVPTDYKIQYWDNSLGWIDIISITNNQRCQEMDPDYHDNCPLEDSFSPVTSEKVRYTFYQNCSIYDPSDWRYVEHGWIRELEVYSGEPDSDGDGVPDSVDNCPNIPNSGQENADSDGLGDACDACPLDPYNDVDADEICGDEDNCPEEYNIDQSDNDLDSYGDVCDPDDDNDGVLDGEDNCPFDSNPDQTDNDGDGAGDECDTDADGDGVIDAFDQCLNTVLGEIVNDTGCSIVDLCPCDNPWKNHGGYVKCVAHRSEEFVADGLITEDDKNATVSAAAQSDCGHKNK